MTRAPRLSLYALLVLMQILAPWVHAHTGTGAEISGFLHLPGLEVLNGIGKAFVEADSRAERVDVVVGVQAGVPGEGQENRLASGDHGQPVLLPAIPALSSSPRFAGACNLVDTPPPGFRFSRHDFASRAPPLNPFWS